VVLAVRDDQIEPAARALAARSLLGHRRRTVAVVHCAGSLGPEALAAVRGPRVAVAQMHPLISFASRKRPPRLARGLLLLQGDPAARRLAAQLGRSLDMKPLQAAEVDLALYHAAAALVANGSAVLAVQGARLLERAGLERSAADAALGALVGSVAENVRQLGLPAALTGPVRRGAHATVRAHLQAIAQSEPQALPLYVALAEAQLAPARELGEAHPDDLAELRRLLRRKAPMPEKLR
jgi:predicted short-subunit dehydrogenase-like oxidoreductase (DUF2520 family)